MSQVVVQVEFLHDTVDIIAQVETVQRARRCRQVVANLAQIRAQVFQMRKIAILAQEMMGILVRQTVVVAVALIALHQVALEAVEIVEAAVVEVVDVVVISRT